MNLIGALALLFCSPHAAIAKLNEIAQLDEIDPEVEQLYDLFEQKETRQEERKRLGRPTLKDFETVSELAELEPFQDIAVISKRFLPKTGRMELNVAGMSSLNNAFFNNFGGSFRGAYYFTEKFGVEGMYFLLTDSDKSVTKGLRNNQNVLTESLVAPESFYGLTFKWVPVYGKMALFNNKIIPFDIYLAPGFGQTKTALGQSEITYHVGTGQMFALSKSLAFRWDFSLNFYQATVLQRLPDTTIQEVKKNHKDFFISVGVSFFFPEASYR